MRLQLPAELREPVERRLAWADEHDVAGRLRRRDPSLWPGDAGPWLGWVDAPERMAGAAEEAVRFAAEVRERGLTDAILLGMGGSSLAPEVLAEVAGGDGLALHVLDSTHPDAVAAVRDRVDLERTLVVVASKSGGTLEVVSLLALFAELIADRDRFVAITDPGTALEQRAREEGFGRIFLGDPEIGGRFSALSPFGLVPAALAGVDVEGLLERARAVDVADGVRLGAALGELALHGRDKLTFAIEDRFGALGAWIEQLVAESSGKDGRGILPVVGARLAAPAAYADDRAFVSIGAAGRDVSSVAYAGHPLVSLDAHDPLDVGAQFLLWEIATAVACSVLEVNAFDQPNVQESKTLTQETIERWREQGEDIGPPDVVDGALEVRGAPGAGDAAAGVAHALEGLCPGRYLAILAYLALDAQTEAALESMRITVRDARRCAATVGWGPRYLHSTGQLHKGGPAVGAFLVVTGRPAGDLEVPGAGYGFDALVRAQAAGDLAALRRRDLRAVHVHLAGDQREAVHELVAAVEAAVAP